MITEIGIAAGEIWNYLDKNGRAGLDDLVKGTGQSRELVLMSLGWLARESHVSVAKSGDKLTAELKSRK